MVSIISIISIVRVVMDEAPAATRGHDYNDIHIVIIVIAYDSTIIIIIDDSTIIITIMGAQTAGHKPRGRKQNSFIYDAFHHVLLEIWIKIVIS